VNSFHPPYEHPRAPTSHDADNALQHAMMLGAENVWCWSETHDLYGMPLREWMLVRCIMAWDWNGKWHGVETTVALRDQHQAHKHLQILMHQAVVAGIYAAL
jgi:uncharacterized membrane protein